MLFMFKKPKKSTFFTISAILRLVGFSLFFPLFAAHAAADLPAYSNGSLIKGNTPEVYLISNSLKRWITDEKTFNGLQFDWQKINIVSDEILKQYPTGQAIKSASSYPDDVLLKGSSPKVFLIKSNQKRWIPNEDTFLALDLKWENIMVIDDNRLKKIYQGSDLASLSYTPNRPETKITKSPEKSIESTDASFEFDALIDVWNINKITFETFLEGQDTNWVNNSSSQSRNFNLPKENKSYTFFVRAKNKQGYVDLTPARYQFDTKISPYYDQVQINGGSAKSSAYEKESVEIYNRANYNINVTGWTISAERGKNSYALPQAYIIPGYDDLSYTGNLELRPSDRIILYTKRSPLGYSKTTKSDYSFRLNKCTGYLNDTYDFSPALPNQCPKIELTDEEKDSLDNDCLNFIKNLSGCHKVTGAEYSKRSASCRDFLKEKVSYSACVSEHRFDNDFYKNQWNLYLGRTGEVWNNTSETLILRDANGLVVDQYKY